MGGEILGEQRGQLYSGHLILIPVGFIASKYLIPLGHFNFVLYHHPFCVAI